MTMQWIFGQVADHGKQGQLPQVEQGFSWEASSKEENNGACVFSALFHGFTYKSEL